jgi:tetratricopeptide (TPR) repeat protein
MRTLAEAAGLAYTHLRHEESLQRSLSAIELARRIDDPRAEVVARFYAVGAHYTRGNLEEAGRHATEVLPVSEKLRDRIWLSGALWRNDIVSHLAGDWRTAREFSDRGLAISDQSLWFLCTRVLLEYEVGEFGQGEAYLNRLLEAMALASPAAGDYSFCTVVLLLVDRITGDAKWIDVAAEAAKRVVAAAPPPLSILSARAALGLAAALRGEADSAGEQYQRYPSPLCFT